MEERGNERPHQLHFRRLRSRPTLASRPDLLPDPLLHADMEERE